MRNYGTDGRTQASRRGQGPCTALILALLTLAPWAHAAVFRCQGANGVTSYSDHPCDPPAPTSHGAADSAASASALKPVAVAPRAEDAAVLTPKELKARQILLLLRLNSGPGADPAASQQIPDTIAPDLVRNLDPENGGWNPQNGRWHSMLEFVKADLRIDLAAAVKLADERALQEASRRYAALAQGADMDALLQYLNSPAGGRFIAFQNVVRLITAQSLKDLLAQEPIVTSPGTESIIRQRLQLLSLSLEAKLVTDGGGQSYGAEFEGAPGVLENAARREGTALDALLAEYGSDIANFSTFSQSPTARHFFAAVDPAYRAARAITSTTAAGFAATEEAKYGQRWQGQYGARQRVTVVRSRYSTVTLTTNGPGLNTQSLRAESMATQCEQRESSQYQAHNRNLDPATRSIELKRIQNQCRSEQNLPLY